MKLLIPSKILAEKFLTTQTCVSYHSNGVLLWDFVSARPDTCPERAGSGPLYTKCAASSPLQFCRRAGQRAAVKYQNMIHDSVFTCMYSVEYYSQMVSLSQIILTFTQTHTCSCALSQLFCMMADHLVSMKISLRRYINHKGIFLSNRKTRHGYLCQVAMASVMLCPGHQMWLIFASYLLIFIWHKYFYWTWDILILLKLWEKHLSKQKQEKFTIFTI